MPVQEVEEKTGYTFFSAFSDSKQKKLKETKDLDWWQEK
jgi:DNA/RNA endonuclease G (NUC1)